MRLNPLLAAPVFTRERADLATIQPMTAEGAAMKTLLLLALALASAAFAWLEVAATGARASALPWWGLLAAAAAAALAARGWPRGARVLAPLHALLLGLGAGGVAAAVTAGGRGVAVHLAGVCFATVFGLLFASNAGLLGRRPTGLRAVFVVAVAGLLFSQAVAIVVDLFSGGIPLLSALPLAGVAFTAAVAVSLGALLVRDMHALEAEAERGAPPHMEWHGALALLSAVLWLWLQPIVLGALALGGAGRALARRREAAARPAPKRAAGTVRMRVLDPEAS